MSQNQPKRIKLSPSQKRNSENLIPQRDISQDEVSSFDEEKIIWTAEDKEISDEIDERRVPVEP